MRSFARQEVPHEDRDDFANLRKLSPYVWRYGKRVSLALGCLLLSKLAVVCVPLVLKSIIDRLDLQQSSIDTEQLVVIVPMALLLAYGALRLISGFFSELRDILFSRVRYSAMHQMSVDVLQHLHRLSLRFHLERNTGGISRDLERGTRSLASVLNMLVFSILPTFIEFVLVVGILFFQYDSFLIVVILATVACLLYTSPSPRDLSTSRMPSSA